MLSGFCWLYISELFPDEPDRHTNKHSCVLLDGVMPKYLTFSEEKVENPAEWISSAFCSHHGLHQQLWMSDQFVEL